MPYFPTNVNAYPKSIVDSTDSSGGRTTVRQPKFEDLTGDEDPARAPIFTDQTFQSSHFSLTTAAELGFAVTSGEASADQRYSLIEWRRYRQYERKSGVIEFWGVSIRYAVEYRAVDVKGKLNIPALAAEAQLGRASVQLDFSVRGIATDRLVTEIPVRTELNVETYAEMVEAINGIRKEIREDPDKVIIPVLIGVLTTPNLTIDSTEDEDLDRSVAITFALTALAQGVALDEARKDWRGNDDLNPLIAEVYSAYGAAGKKVSPLARRRAADEIAHYRLGRQMGPVLVSATLG